MSPSPHLPRVYLSELVARGQTSKHWLAEFAFLLALARKGGGGGACFLAETKPDFEATGAPKSGPRVQLIKGAYRVMGQQMGHDVCRCLSLPSQLRDPRVPFVFYPLGAIQDPGELAGNRPFQQGTPWVQLTPLPHPNP